MPVTSTPALADTVTSFVDAVATFPEADTTAFPSKETDPTLAVAALPLALTPAPAVAVTLEVDTVAEFPSTGQTHALPVATTVPTAAVDAGPVTDTLAMPVAVTDPTEAVAELPLALTEAAAATVTDEVETVAELPVADTLAAASKVTEPTDAVDPGNASSASPQVLSPHAILLEFHPCHATFASAIPLTCYAILMIAFEASAAGNSIVKSPAVEVLSPPKARTTTALFAEPAVVLEL